MNRDESGASLVIALIFVVAIAAILIAIVNLSGTNITDTVQLQNQRATEYASDAVVDSAIQAVRYQDPISTCTTSTPLTLGSIEPAGADQIIAYCSQSGGGSVLNFRQVTVYACGSSYNGNFAGCKSNSLLTAIVQYDDQDSSGARKVGNAVGIISWTVNVTGG